MTILARKWLRETWQLRGQLAAVALVAAVGVANLVMTRSALESLERSQAKFYREQSFADVFVDFKRAPLAVGAQLRAVPGVQDVQARITAHGRIELSGFAEPVRVQAVSLAEGGDDRLNRLHLRSGRIPLRGERDAVVVSDAFAQAHSLAAGQALHLVLHGRRHRVTIAGVGTTPEFVQQMAPGSLFPDARRFAIVWMPRAMLEAMVDMDGAFNSATLTLARDARPEAVLREVDAVLARYGGTGAIDRAEQRSHRYLAEEFRQLRTMAWLFPAVFLGVSAFVLFVVLGRVIAAQRQQIGTLRAFGFGIGELWVHYAGFALAVACVGALGGIALGGWLGSLMADIYREFYRLPALNFAVPADVAALAFAVSLASALAGAAVPAWRAAHLHPAEALRLAPPWQGRMPRPRSRRTRMSEIHRLVIRHLGQRPARSALACLGLAFGTAIMMMGRFQHDSIQTMVRRQFDQAERYDVSASLYEPGTARILAEAASIPGVLAVQSERAVPVRVRWRAASYRTALVGVPPVAPLRRLLGDDGHEVAPPPHGVMLTDHLAESLGARRGDMIELEVLEGERRTLRLPLAGTVSEPFGSQAYVSLEQLGRLLGEGERVGGILLAVDPDALRRVVDTLERRPGVAGIGELEVAMRNFNDSMADTILTFTAITLGFGVVITAGVVYSNVNVALAERARDLASLRVLGFTAAETAYLLLAELAVLATAALPLGYAVGMGLVVGLAEGFDSDLFRIPRVVAPATYALAGIVSLAATVLAALWAGRRVMRLDLLGVLKAHD